MVAPRGPTRSHRNRSGFAVASCIFTLALMPQSALAADAPTGLSWAEVMRIADAKYGRAVFVAREGVVVDGFAKYWNRLVYTVPHPVGVYDNAPIAPENIKGQAQFIEMWTLHLMDCNRQTVATSRADFYDTGGRVVSRGLINQGPAPIEPKSIQALAADIVCH